MLVRAIARHRARRERRHLLLGQMLHAGRLDIDYIAATGRGDPDADGDAPVVKFDAQDVLPPDDQTEDH